MRIDVKQLQFIEPLLRHVVQVIEAHFGFELTITSLYRMDAEFSVHGQLPLRGIDIRCHDEHVGVIIEAWVNRRWTYDPDRLNKMCCLFHDSGNGLHLHIQVHKNTVEN